jgi:hypothetical protein
MVMVLLLFSLLLLVVVLSAFYGNVYATTAAF